MRGEITELESNSTRTPKQEQELTDKRNELVRLEEEMRKLESQRQQNSSNSETKPTDKPWGLIISEGIAGVVLIIFLVIVVRRREDQKI